MKLTQSMRTTLVNSVMADISQEDFAGRLRSLAQQIAADLLPPLVRRVWDDVELRGALRMNTVYMDGGWFFSVSVPTFGRDDVVQSKVQGDKRVQTLLRKSAEQKKARVALKRELTTSLVGITTDNLFREQFPELAHYLPKTQPPVPNLPAVVPHLMKNLKAAGLKVDTPVATS